MNIVPTLEEPELLPSRCRDRNAARMIQEAVAGYTVAAYRSAIVSTWIAIVYDLFGKLRELALTGDAAAQKYVLELEDIVAKHDVRAALTLENRILEIAREEFEFITALEHADLKRIHDDRQRCAHPSLNSPEEAYNPPPELVRLHLRNAVAHLLSQHPVQSKAALDRLQAEVDSELFPKSSEEAATYFAASVYAKPKDSLLRGFCAAVISSVLTDDKLDQTRGFRRLRALRAMQKLHPSKVNSVLQDKLTPAARRTPDAILDRLIFLLSSLPDAYRFLESDVRIRLTNFIAQTDFNKEPAALRFALYVEDLRDNTLKRIQQLSTSAILTLLRAEKRTEFLERAVDLYVSSTNFDDSNYRAVTLIIPYSDSLSESQINTILEAFPKKKDLYWSNKRMDVFRALHATKRCKEELLKAALSKSAFRLSETGEIEPETPPT